MCNCTLLATTCDLQNAPCGRLWNVEGVPVAEREDLRLRSEMLTLAHDRGVYLPTRTIHLGHGVDEKSVRRLAVNLHALEDMDDAEKITIILSNTGGDDWSMLAAYDLVRKCPCPVVGLVRGVAASAASVLLQACDVRIMGPSSVQLVHYGSASNEGHALDVQRAAREAERVNRWLEGVYLARIREKQPEYQLESLRGMLRFDTYLTADQCVTLGLADEVG
jgi:ATP-dependent protease ClpP protease subunit